MLEAILDLAVVCFALGGTLIVGVLIGYAMGVGSISSNDIPWEDE